MPDTNDRPSSVAQDWANVASGWRHWEPHIVAFTWPVTARIVEALQVGPGHRVLDVGCGIGDPALAIARQIAPSGRVLAVDPAREMIDTARSRAESFGLDNIKFEIAAAEDLDPGPGSFDAICGRWSFIFCERIVDVLRRARTWLKSGGRFAMSTWTPTENSPGFMAINAAVNRQVKLPPPDPSRPGMLHLSEPGQLEQALNDAGFGQVRVEPVQLAIFARDGDDFWSLMVEMGCSLSKLLAGLTPEQRDAIRREVVAAVEQHRADDVLRIPALAQVGVALA